MDPEPLTRNVRALRAHSDLSPPELGFTRVRHLKVAEVRYIRLRPGRGEAGYANVMRNSVRAELNAAGDSSIENLLAPGIQISWKFFAPSNSSGSSGHGSSSPQIPSTGHAISLRRGTRFGIEV